MTIEIIIPTKDRPKDLQLALDSILEQSYLPEKVVVVDSGTIQIDVNLFRQKFSAVNVAFKHICSRAGLTYQRNVGIQQIEKDLVLFLDDDVVLESDYIIQMVKVFKEDKKNEIGGATGKVTNFSYQPSPISKLIRKLFYLPLPSKGEILPSGSACSVNDAINEAIQIQWLSGCNMMYRKEVFDWNWFDENLTSYSYAEDLDFSYRIGRTKRLMYVPSSRLVHNSSPVSRLSEKNRYSMLLRNHTYLFKKNIPKTFHNRLAFFLSLHGIVLQTLLLQRSLNAFRGALQAWFEVMFMNNYKMPNYLERLDFHHPYKNQIAEHRFRYHHIAQYCEGKKVLDCASGEGIGINILKDSAKSVIGLDIDNDTISRARKNITATNVKFIQGSALSLPFEANTFDVVVSSETIEHIPSKFHDIMIAEFYRVLKIGGMLILTTPNKNRTSPNFIAAGNCFHIAELRYEELKQLLENHFKDVKIKGLFNFTREGSIEKIRSSYTIRLNETKPINQSLTFKKKIIRLLPFQIRDLLSLLTKKRHIYPTEKEYSYLETDAEIAANLLAVCIKSK